MEIKKRRDPAESRAGVVPLVSLLISGAAPPMYPGKDDHQNPISHSDDWL